MNRTTPILLSVYTLIVAGVVWSVARATGPNPTPQTKIEYIDRVIEKRDTVTVDRPIVRRIYERQTDTVRVHIPVPENWSYMGVIAPHPIRIDNRRVTVTYWNPDSLRFMQDLYEIPVRKWAVSVSAGADCNANPSCTASALLNIRRQRLTLFGGYQFANLPTGTFHGPAIGIRTTLIGRP